MKKNLSLFLMGLVCLLYTGTTTAQTHCNGYTTNTDWRNYAAPTNPPTIPVPPYQNINDFNWSAAEFTVYKDAGNGNITTKPLKSPFWENQSGLGNAINVQHFRDKFYNNGFYINPTQAIESVDIWPEDGWELLYKDLGTPTEGYINNPSFALYNRFTGIIRIFYYVEELGSTASETARISVEPRFGKKNNAVLSFTQTELNALDGFERHLTDALNKSLVVPNFWLFVEIPTAFDPCICRYPTESQFEIKFEVVKQGTIILNGNASGFSKPTIYNNGIYTPIKSNMMASHTKKKGSTDFLKEANGYYKTLSNFKDNVNTMIGHQDNKKEDKAKAATEINTLFDNWKTVAKAIPKLGAAIGIIDFLVTGGKAKNTETREPTPVGYETELNLELTGIIKEDQPLGITYLRTPGANNVGSPNPVYNNPLGVFNLLETPPVEYAEYSSGAGSAAVREFYSATLGRVTDQIIHIDNQPFPANNVDFFADHKIREYKLRKSSVYNRLINYIINPSSQLVAKQIKGALVFKFTNMPDDVTIDNYFKHVAGPVEFGITQADRTTYNFVHRMRMLGYEIESWPEGTDKLKDITFRTHYANLACLEDEAQFFTWEYDGTNYTDEPEVWLKLDIQLERTDDYAVANPSETQDVMMVLKYKTNITKNSTTGLTYTANMFLLDRIDELVPLRKGYEILPNGDFQPNSKSFSVFSSLDWSDVPPNQPYQWDAINSFGLLKQHTMSPSPFGSNPINKRYGSLVVDNSNAAFFNPPHTSRTINAYNLYIDPSVSNFSTHHIINVGNQVYSALNWSTINSNINWQQNTSILYIAGPGSPEPFFGSTFSPVESSDPQSVASILAVFDLNDLTTPLDISLALPFITDFVTRISPEGTVLLTDNNNTGTIHVQGYKFCANSVLNYQATQSEVSSFCTGTDYNTLSSAKAGDIDENTTPSNPEELSKESLTVYPNPNSGVFASKFTVNGTKQVSLSINDLTGKTIETIIDNKTYTTGTYKQNIFLDNIKAGVYICNITIGETVLKEKIVVIK